MSDVEQSGIGALPLTEDRAAGLRPQPAAPFSQSSIPSADERLTTAERLPTRAQIDAITNVADLAAIQDDVCAAIKQIEVDLEFRSDDEADEHWEHRARRALTAHHICNTNLCRRLSVVRRGGKDKTRIRNATPEPFRDLLLNIARNTITTRRAA